MPLATSPDKRGLKRICMSCSTRFYDFNKRPIVCPNCETEFTGDIKIKARRSRISNDDEGPITSAMAEEVEIESIKDIPEDEEESDTVSLDDVEEDDVDDDDDEIDANLDLDEEEDDVDDDDDDDFEEDEEEE